MREACGRVLWVALSARLAVLETSCEEATTLCDADARGRLGEEERASDRVLVAARCAALPAPPAREEDEGARRAAVSRRTGTTIVAGVLRVHTQRLLGVHPQPSIFGFYVDSFESGLETSAFEALECVCVCTLEKVLESH